MIIARSSVWSLTASGKSGLWFWKKVTLTPRHAGSIGKRTGVREGAGWVREVTAAQESGGIGRAVRAAAVVDVVRGVGGTRLWRAGNRVG